MVLLIITLRRQASSQVGPSKWTCVITLTLFEDLRLDWAELEPRCSYSKPFAFYPNSDALDTV